MRIYLVRHGIAVDRSDPKCPPDAHRPLTARGEKRTRQVSRGLAVLGVKPEIVLTSPYLRAAQTAEIICSEIGYPVKKLLVSKALLPAQRPAIALEEVAGFKARSVMCIGHAPSLDAILVAALGCSSPVTTLKKSGAVCLEIERSEAHPRSRIVWLFTPKALRLLGRRA